MLLQQLFQSSIFCDYTPSGCLNLGGGFNTRLFAGAVFVFEFGEVFFAASAGTALVVADAGKVGSFLQGKRRGCVREKERERESETGGNIWVDVLVAFWVELTGRGTYKGLFLVGRHSE